MASVWVHLDQRSYPIFLDDNWNALFQEAFPYLNKNDSNQEGSLNGKKVLIVTDENVYDLYHHSIDCCGFAWGGFQKPAASGKAIYSRITGKPGQAFHDRCPRRRRDW